MRNEILIAGSGGQGVISTSVILSKALGIYNGYEVAQTQSYGPEARGGACKAGVVYSNEEIDYMKIQRPDIFIVFNKAGFDKFKDDLTEDTIIFADSTFIQEEILEDYKNVYFIPATRIAETELRPFVANIVMLGAISKVIDSIDMNAIKDSINATFKPHLVELNYNALDLGYKAI